VKELFSLKTVEKNFLAKVFRNDMKSLIFFLGKIKKAIMLFERL